MNKIFSYAMVLFASAVALTSCEKDIDSNPTLVEPTAFVLNEVSVGNGAVDLAKSNGIELTWSQPQFTETNAPVVATYSIDLSSTGNFIKKFDDAADNNTGADYITLDETSTVCTTTINAAEVAKALQKICNFAEGIEFLGTPVYIRVKAAVQNASFEEITSIYSNIIQMWVVPYYVELKDAAPVMWYLVGNMFGGKWGSEIGVTALPMFLKAGYEYDKKTGTGEIEFLNWFGAGAYKDNGENDDWGFKIQPATFNWDWGMTGNSGVPGEIIYRDGGSDGGHIMAPEDGVYMITMNTAKNTATMEKYEGDVKDYGTIQLAGSFNDWNDTPMLPYNKEGVENHAWYYIMENAEAIEFKFKIEGSWDSNWGSNTFPSGMATNNGPNIALEPGKWCISFNDITGAYSIVAL